MLVEVEPVVAELEVAAAVAGREDSAASVCTRSVSVWCLEGALSLEVFRRSESTRSACPGQKDDLLMGEEAGGMLTVYAADRPVTFLQAPEGAFEPATKLTVEHCDGVIWWNRGYWEKKQTGSPDTECRPAHPARCQ